MDLPVGIIKDLIKQIAMNYSFSDQNEYMKKMKDEIPWDIQLEAVIRTEFVLT